MHCSDSSSSERTAHRQPNLLDFQLIDLIVIVPIDNEHRTARPHVLAQLLQWETMNHITVGALLEILPQDQTFAGADPDKVGGCKY